MATEPQGFGVTRQPQTGGLAALVKSGQVVSGCWPGLGAQRSLRERLGTAALGSSSVKPKQQ